MDNVDVNIKFEKFGGPAVSAFQRAIAEAKQRWSVIGWVTKSLLSRASPVGPGCICSS
jgi:hypothetical protein